MLQGMLHSLSPPPLGVAIVLFIPAGRLRPRPRTKPPAGADAPEENPMKWRYPVLIFGGFCCSAWGFIYRPFPMPGEEPLLDLLLTHPQTFYIWVVPLVLRRARRCSRCRRADYQHCLPRLV